MSNFLGRVDLNLLPVLASLLETRNVTRTAELLSVSQPAVSASLGRLRRHFRDDLLVRRGNKYELTSLAEQLAARMPPTLDHIEQILSATPAFDPRTTTREFSIAMSDYCSAVFASRLSRLMSQEAPGVRLRLQPIPRDLMQQPISILRSVDRVVVPHGFLSDFPSQQLFQDSWSCLVANSNGDVGQEVSTDDLARLPWVLLYDRPDAYSPADRQVQAMGLLPHAEVVVESFLEMPFHVAQTNRVALVPTRLATRLEQVFGVRAVPCPEGLGPIVEAFWWDPAYSTDVGHRWLRSTMAEAAADVIAST